MTNDGATILKSLYVDNPAAKVLVGALPPPLPPPPLLQLPCGRFRVAPERCRTRLGAQLQRKRKDGARHGEHAAAGEECWGSRLEWGKEFFSFRNAMRGSRASRLQPPSSVHSACRPVCGMRIKLPQRKTMEQSKSIALSCPC